MNLNRASIQSLWWAVSLLAIIGYSSVRGDQGTPSDDAWAELVAQIDRNVDAGTRLLASARAQMISADKETQVEFTHIERAIRSAEARLRRSLKNAENASPENWPRARTALAANYEAYSQAVSQAERLMALNPSGRRAPPPH